MCTKEPENQRKTLAAVQDRLLILEEKYLYQDRTIDALNEVIIDQQTQLNLLEDQIRRLQELLSAVGERQDGGKEPPPPHY